MSLTHPTLCQDFGQPAKLYYFTEKQSQFKANILKSFEKDVCDSMIGQLLQDAIFKLFPNMVLAITKSIFCMSKADNAFAIGHISLEVLKASAIN